MKLNPRLDKLRKLAAHLRTVPPENFDFGTVWCGTVGCAMGHAVSVFPEEVEFSDPDTCNYQDLRAIDRSSFGYAACAAALFNLDMEDAAYLFTPRNADCVHPDLPYLSPLASNGLVADMLEQFCQLVESGKLEQYEI